MAHGDYKPKSVNFTPIKPLQDARNTLADARRNPSSHNAFFRELFQGLSNENEEGWRECIEQGRMISLLRSGKYIVKGDLNGSGVVYFKRIPGKDRANSPIFPQNCEILTSKWIKIDPTVNARNFGDGYKSEIQTDLVNTYVKSKFRDIFTLNYRVREAYSAQDFGTYITQFEYDDSLNQITQIVPIVRNESKVLVDGYGACYDCGKEGHPNDFALDGAAMPQCPDCGSYRTTDMVPDAVAEETVIADVDTIKEGDIRGSLREWPACRYDARVLPHESDWFIYSERMPLRLIDRLFGEGLDINTDDSSDIGLNVIDALSHRGGTTEGNGDNDLYGTFNRFSEEGTLRSMWLKPSMYAGFKLKEAEKTLGGTIPKDVDYADLFPDGLLIRGFNDMALQVVCGQEKANIASQVFLYQSHSGIGKGIESAADSAKDLNEVFSMAMAGLKRYGASGLAVDKDAGLTPADIKNLFKPQKVTMFDTTNNGGDINKSIMQVQPNPVNPVLPTMMIQLANMVQLGLMTGDFAQGATNQVDINTLGGQQLATAKAEEQKGGIYGRLVDHRCQAATIITDLQRQHGKIPRYYTPEGDKHGRTRGKWISGADMPKELKFDSVPESEVPENKFEKRMARQEMVEKAGGLAAFAEGTMMNPKLAAWYAQGSGVELPGMNRDEIKLVCLSRLENILELSQMMPDPEMILANLTNRLKVREESHLLKSEFLQEILDDDEVSEWNPIAQMTVELLIERHHDLEAEAQVRNEMVKMRAAQKLQAEQMAFEQQMMQPQMDQANQQMQEQAMMGAIAEVGGRVLDDEQKAVDMDREEEQKEAEMYRQEQSKENDLARQRESEDIQHERNLELEDRKAANKPAPKKPAARGK